MMLAFISLLFDLLWLSPLTIVWQKAILPNPVPGQTKADFTLPNITYLDAPKLSFINDSVFDWWYFDAVSSSSPNVSVVVVFFTSPAEAFSSVALNSSSVLNVVISASLPNGSTVASSAVADLAVVRGNEQYVGGSWLGSGASWMGVDELGAFEVRFNSTEQLGVTGTIKLDSISSPHYCPDLQVTPHVGWAAAVPDAEASVNLEILGESLTFKGWGYHDKNWSDRPFNNETVKSWYWGHAHFGPFSIVWFDVVAPDNTRHVSGYLAENGETILSICGESDRLSVLPVVNETFATYPPVSGEVPDAFLIYMDLKDRIMRVKVFVELETTTNGVDMWRWTGAVIGGLDGGDVYGGTGLMEQFILG